MPTNKARSIGAGSMRPSNCAVRNLAGQEAGGHGREQNADGQQHDRGRAAASRRGRPAASAAMPTQTGGSTGNAK